MKFLCVQARVREYNSFETWDMFFLQTERAISFPSNQWIFASREDQGYSLTERPHRENTWQHARERSWLPPFTAALGRFGCEPPLSSCASEIILLKSVKLKSSKWEQNGILKMINSTKVAYIKIVLLMVYWNVTYQARESQLNTGFDWSIQERLMWYSCSRVGAGEGKASLRGRRNTVHQKCLFFHMRAEIYFNMPWCPFSLKINTLILWSTIPSGRVSTFQSPMRYSKAALLPNRMRCLCRCSHFPAKTSWWSISVLSWGGFLLPWQPAAVHTPQKTSSHHPGRTGNAVPYLKDTFPKDKTKQHRREQETLTLAGAGWNNRSSQTAPSPCMLGCRLCFKSLRGRCFVWLKCPAGLISVSETGGSLCFFSIYLSPFKQLPINLEIHASPPHRASSRQQSQTQPVQRSCPPQKAEGPPHLSWVWGRPKPRLDDMQEQIIVSCAMIR